MSTSLDAAREEASLKADLAGTSEPTPAERAEARKFEPQRQSLLGKTEDLLKTAERVTTYVPFAAVGHRAVGKQARVFVNGVRVLVPCDQVVTVPKPVYEILKGAGWVE